jgi:hypothetical protein
MAMSVLFWLGENVTATFAGGLITNKQPSLAHSSFYKYQPYKYCRCVTHVANPT